MNLEGFSHTAICTDAYREPDGLVPIKPMQVLIIARRNDPQFECLMVWDVFILVLKDLIYKAIPLII